MIPNAEKPPKGTRLLLGALLRREDRDDRLADYEERFAEISGSEGRAAARRWYRSHVLRSAPELIINSIYWSGAMFQSYFRLAMRHMRRQKLYAFLNAAGLAIGLAVFIMMALYVDNERSFDGFHAGADRTYRVVRRYAQLAGHAEALVGGTPGPLMPTMRREFPEVADGARVGEVDGLFRLGEANFSQSGLYADDGFFRLFRFPLVAGDQASALAEPNALVLTRRLARTLFGPENPLGRVVSFSQRMNERRGGNRNERFDLKVTGVIEDPPANTHLRFDFLISFETIASLEGGRAGLENWGRSSYYAYVLLRPGTRQDGLSSRLAEYTPRFRPGDQGRYVLQPLRSIHWEPVMDDLPGNRTNERKLMLILTSTAFFILLIAGINATNLAVARFSKRTREIGLRKVVGARRSQLVGQFLGESLAFSFAAAAAAAGMVVFLLPMFNGLVERNVQAARLASPAVLPVVLAVVVLTGILSGLYPAFALSSLSPALTAKGRTSRRIRRFGFRSSLVVLQFALSVFLLSGMFVVSAQLRFTRSKDLGYSRENVIVLPLRDEAARAAGDAIKAEILRRPAFLSAAGSEYIPLERNNLASIGFRNVAGEWTSFQAFTSSVNYGFLDVFKLRLVQGRDFSPNFATDVRSAVIVNETAAKKAGWKDPIGQIIDEGGRRVIGVVADFHQSSLHDAIEPMIFNLTPREYTFLSVRLRPGSLGEALGVLKTTIEAHSPSFPFEYYFQDEYLQSQYQADARFGRVFGAGAGLAVLIAGLGVFGLVSFAAERRTKEIAVRKVLGASVGRVVRLLTAEYVILAVPACLLAWPASWAVMTQWLRSFAFRTPIQPWMFILAGGLAAFLAVAAAAFKSRSAALRSPTDALRME